MWRWRYWVIDALNRDLPFDQFTIEQLAGDLLPAATLDQKIATGFNRNHRGNAEGGIIPAQYAAEYVADRVETTATVWLGLTVGCARCHDHKYDPVRQRDCLFQIMGDEHHRGARTRPQGQKLVLHQGSSLHVERTERLVHEQDFRLVDEGLGQCHALAHAAGKLVGIMLLEAGKPDAGDPVARFVIGRSLAGAAIEGACRNIV